ncbi:O-antigen ligase family protein [uncultured Lacinutrix sp.]|uniref:O-antigen ligase family protein n=1 Tax=uncultured Lacinutrix sp. TaxID=574032 RepID=UPI00261B4E51|nr:O-antigen ligase family protein [uncultured Lacinutrix sp.]
MEKILKKADHISYIIIILYLLTMFVPSLGAFDFASTQWLYIGIVNTAVFIYYLLSPQYLSFSVPKYVKWFFYIQLGTFLLSCVSMTQSIIIDESIIYISRIFSFIFSVFNLYILFRRKNKYTFWGLSLLVSIVLFIESFEVFYYFSSRFNELRTHELLLEIPSKYGNRNILATAIVIKLPFLLYLFLELKGLKKIISLLTVLLVITSLLLIGARTAVLIMAIVLVLFSVTYFIISKYSIKKSVKVIFPLLLVSVIAYGFSISINRIYDDKLNSYSDLMFTKREKDLYNPKAKTNLINGSGRDYIWESAIKDFKKSPVIGVGIGNWRHNSKIDISKNNTTEGIVFNTHVHNDYLQSLAETGIIGFMLYLSVYIISLVLLFKRFIHSERASDRIFVIVIALALIGYMIDAFFNFPHHRAPIQIVFAFILAIIISFSNVRDEHPQKKYSNKTLKALGVLMTVLLAVNLVNHYMDFKMSKIQYSLMVEVKTKDAFTETYNYSYEQVNNMLPDFPYVNQIGMTNDDIRGMFAINTKQYDKALLHLDNSISSVENNLWPKTLKAMLYNVKKNEDSAYIYSKEVFDLAPSVESNFYILKDIYKKRKDTIALFNLYDKHFKVRPKNIKGWLNMCNDIRVYYRNDSLALNKVNDALKRYPYDESLIKYKKELKNIMSSKSKSDIIASKLKQNVIDEMTKYFKEGNKFFEQKEYIKSRQQFLKVLELEPNNLPTHFKLGLLENITKNYKAAIPYFTKVINDKYLDNGRPEYSRGVSYLKLNDISNAKKDFIVSRNKGWQAALNLNDSFFE